MKLYQSPTSPYVRMARATAEKLGLADRLELMNARADQAAYEKLNPLNKVPCLVTDDEEVLIESRLICQYLNDLADGNLYPKDANARRAVLQLEAVIHGIMDAVVAHRQESRHSDAPASAEWLTRQKRKIDIGLALIESDLATYTDTKIIAPILMCCMCSFMDRVYAEDWREKHPGLARWYETYRQEPHMAATEVKA